MLGFNRSGLCRPCCMFYMSVCICCFCRGPALCCWFWVWSVVAVCLYCLNSIFMSVCVKRLVIFLTLQLWTKRKTDTYQQRIQFYSRTVNLTNIRFSQEELALLNNGLQYSIEKHLKKYWTDLIMETEQAIRMLDIKMQAPFRILATKKQTNQRFRQALQRNGQTSNLYPKKT